MTRLLWLVLVFPALGQTPAAPAADSLEQTANKRTQEWDKLATGLESKIARMLPCDPRVRDALQEVSRASDARLAAVSRYLEAAQAQAKNDVGKARQALAEQQAAAKDLETERTEAEQERAAIDGEIANLAESAKRREALDDARKKLQEIRAKIEARIGGAQQEAARRAALIASLEELQTGYDARQKAIAAEISALASETARWGEYYATRLARAQTECSITNPGAPQRKKP